MARRAWNWKRARQHLSLRGLKPPALPPELARSLRDITPEDLQHCGWALCTRPVRLPPWRMDSFVREAEAGVVADYALLSQLPLTVYGFHYYLVRGGLRLFLQLDWDPGLYHDDSAQLRPVARSVALADALVAAAVKAEKEGVIGPHEALTVVASATHGCWWRRPGEPRPPSTPAARTGTPESTLEESLAWLKASRRGSSRQATQRRPPQSPSSTSSRVPRSPRPIRWVEAAILSSLGPGVAFDHLYVIGTPVAFIDADALQERASTSLSVRILKLIDSNPIRIRTNWSSSSAEAWKGTSGILAQEHPFEWAKVVEDVKRAVQEYLDGAGTGLLAGNMVDVRRATS